jgi:hypothetical protein
MIEKIINGGNYQPTITDKIVLDSTPTVNSLNGVTSDAVARAIAGASGEVPQVTQSDNGKILTAIYDAGGPAVEWAEAPERTPGHHRGIPGRCTYSRFDRSRMGCPERWQWRCRNA